MQTFILITENQYKSLQIIMKGKFESEWTSQVSWGFKRQSGAIHIFKKEIVEFCFPLSLAKGILKVLISLSNSNLKTIVFDLLNWIYNIIVFKMNTFKYKAVTSLKLSPYVMKSTSKPVLFLHFKFPFSCS